MPRLTTAPGRSSCSGATGDHLADVERERRDLGVLELDLAAVGGVVALRERLHVVRGARDHHVVDEDAGDPDRVRRAVARGRDRSTWTITVPPEFFVACAIASESSVIASCSVVMLPSASAVVPRRNATSTRRLGKNRCSSPKISSRWTSRLAGGGVEAAAVEPGVDERAEADLGHEAGAARGDLAVELGDHALRQAVGVDVAGESEAPERGREAPVAADRAPRPGRHARGG